MRSAASVTTAAAAASSAGRAASVTTSAAGTAAGRAASATTTAAAPAAGRRASLTALYAGSFDPPSNGHVDIIRRASAMCDELIIGVALNADKKCMFTTAERVGLIQRMTRGLPHAQRMRVTSFEGLVVDYAKEANGVPPPPARAAARRAQRTQYASARAVSFLVRGLRAYSDFEYEFRMALINRKLTGIEVRSRPRIHEAAAACGGCLPLRAFVMSVRQCACVCDYLDWQTRGVGGPGHRVSPCPYRAARVCSCVDVLPHGGRGVRARQLVPHPAARALQEDAAGVRTRGHPGGRVRAPRRAVRTKMRGHSAGGWMARRFCVGCAGPPAGCRVCGCRSSSGVALSTAVSGRHVCISLYSRAPIAHNKQNCRAPGRGAAQRPQSIIETSAYNFPRTGRLTTRERTTDTLTNAPMPAHLALQRVPQHSSPSIVSPHAHVSVTHPSPSGVPATCACTCAATEPITTGAAAARRTAGRGGGGPDSRRRFRSARVTHRATSRRWRSASAASAVPQRASDAARTCAVRYSFTRPNRAFRWSRSIYLSPARPVSPPPPHTHTHPRCDAADAHRPGLRLAAHTPPSRPSSTPADSPHSRACTGSRHRRRSPPTCAG